MRHHTETGWHDGALAETGVNLCLGEFGHEALEWLVGGGGSEWAAVRAASIYYLSDRDTERTAWRVPRFAGAAPRGRAVKIRLQTQTWEALVDEADRQGVAPEVLLAHAVLYFLSAVDAAMV
jgi:hypothetical protein